MSFSVIGSIDNKPIMVDDTCYFVPCDSVEEATFISNAFLCQPLSRNVIPMKIKIYLDF
ncbi:hypothetical protein ES703_113932 [subsurface metagenome]